jgi:hypothetical protein
VLGPFTFDKVRADQRNTQQSRNDVIGWAKAIAEANGVNLSLYARVLIAMNVQTDTSGSAGFGTVCD